MNTLPHIEPRIEAIGRLVESWRIAAAAPATRLSPAARYSFRCRHFNYVRQSILAELASPDHGQGGLGVIVVLTLGLLGALLLGVH